MHKTASSVVITRKALPLQFDEEWSLYKSDIEGQTLFESVHRKCQVGAMLSSLGAFSTLVGLSSFAPVPVVAAFSVGVVVNCYMLFSRSKGVLRQLALRHVDSLAVSTSADVAESAPPKSAIGMDWEETMDARLDATPVVYLSIRSPNVTRRVTLGFPAPGTDSADRPQFGNGIYEKLRLFHVDLEDEDACQDLSLLTAVLETSKVIVDEEVECRDDVPNWLQFPNGAGAPGVMLSAVTNLAVDRVEHAISDEPPIDAAVQIGRKALAGGFSAFAGGTFFVACAFGLYRGEDGHFRFKFIHGPDI